jgi:minor extracellular protease Epr
MSRVFLALMAVVLLASGTLAATTPSSASVDRVRVFIQLPDFPRAEDVVAIRSLGGELRHEFPDLRIISVEVPAAVVAMLERNPRFTSIEPVPLMALVEDTLPWGIDRINAEHVWGGGEKAVNVQSGRISGAGVKVAVIDTGIAAHADLNIVGGISYVSGVTSYHDDNGHGTHVAGTVAARDNGTGVLGVAPNAELQAVKVLNAQGSGYLDDVAKGIDWARLNGSRVMNMSLSCSGSLTCDHTVLRTAVQNAANAGVVVVAAAGNSGAGTNTVGWPARYDGAIAVAATTNTDARASFSSTGPAVELAAPGASIYSTYPGGFATMSGTSMAAPHVAGLAALLVECGLSGPDARSRMQSTALDLGTAGRDESFGFGLIRADAATTTCGTSGGTTPPPAPAPSAPAPITEGFESGSWSGGSGWTSAWTRSGSTPSIITTAGPQAGSRHLRLRSNGTVTRTLSLASHTDPVLRFWAKAQSWEGNDGARVQVSSNGSTWTTLKTFTTSDANNVYKQYEVSLAAFKGAGAVYLRFQGTMGDTSDFFYVDSIEIVQSDSAVLSEPPESSTSTPVPSATNTPVPQTPATNTPVPTATATSTPSGPQPTSTPTLLCRFYPSYC